MTEYWKSNARKFCDYCKCWFADNKPSIDFHEAGKKHKENVAKRLQDIGKRGRDDYETSLRMDDYMKEMEQAALRAYRADIGSNPDLTGSAIADLAKEKNADLVLKSDQEKPPEKKPPTDSKWLEAKASDGRSYYFHTDTRETKWEIPTDGFVSIEDQRTLKEEKKRAKKKKKKHGESSSKSDEKSSSSGGEGGTLCASESQQNSIEQPEDASLESKGARGYGSWTTIEKPVMPDLQLPTVVSSGADYEEEEFDYTNYPKPEPHQFTQKTVTLKGTASGTDFKKRKNCDSFKKNARMRNNDL